MGTTDTKLVEASKFDFIWGIGLDEQAAKNTPDTVWPGKNWLGNVLTKLRNDLVAEQLTYGQSTFEI